MKMLNMLFDGLSRKRLSCRQVEKVMHQYLDKELDPAEVPKVLAHLEQCRDCGLEAEMYTRIKSTLQAHQETPSDESMANVRALAAQLATTGLPDN